MLLKFHKDEDYEFLFVLIACVTAYKPNAAENDFIKVRFFQLLSTLTDN